MKSLGNLLQNTLATTVGKKASIAHIVEITNQYLAQTFGPEIQNLAEARYIKNDAIFIACLSNLIAQEIKYKENELLERINNTIQGVTIKKINFL
jgi:hypothetical protein